MKNYLKPLIFIPLIVFLTSASCKKEEIDTGFTCKVNDKRWRPYVDDFKLQETECHLYNKNEELFITARNTNLRQVINLGVYTQGVEIKVGIYDLDVKETGTGIYDELKPKEDFRTGNGYTGILEIKSIDEANKRMTGTFYFNAHNETTGQTVKITSGTFNLKYVNY